MWKDDERDKGVHYYANEDKYDGQYKDNKRGGKGIQYYKGEGKYEGEWQNDKKHGQGSLYTMY